MVSIIGAGAGLSSLSLLQEISSKTDIRNRGKVMGVADSLQSLSQIFTPVIGGIFIEAVFPGSLGFLAVIIFLPSMIIFYSSRWKKPTIKQRYSSILD